MEYTSFNLARDIFDRLSFEDIVRKQYDEELELRSREQRSIDPKQISTGSGVVENPSYMVPGYIAERLNQINNPERNGLIMLWAYNLYRIFNGNQNTIDFLIDYLYGIGDISYSAGAAIGGAKRGRKRKEEKEIVLPTQEFNIKADDLGFTTNLPAEFKEKMTVIEYEKLYRFITQCMLPSIQAFQAKYSAGIIYKSINFKGLALNLHKAIREMATLSLSDQNV